MRGKRLGLAAAVILVVALVDCRQVAGVSVLASAPDACRSCVSGSCGAPQSACESTYSSCAARLDCELACDPDDVACRSGCMTAPVGDGIGLVEACESNECAAACAHACGDIVPIVPAAAAASCAACIVQQCCMPAQTCATDAECRAGLECARAGSEPDVVDTCTGALHPSGTADYQAFEQCIIAGCAQPCSTGQDFTCLHAVRTPRPDGTTIQGTLTILDGASQSDGVPNLEVAVCQITDPDCTMPYGPIGKTDAHGSVEVTLPTQGTNGPLGFIGYFQVTDPSGTYLQTLAFPGFNLTQTGFTQSFVVATLSEVQALAMELNRTYDPSTGSMVVSATDCAYQPIPGATFAPDPTTSQSIVIYSKEGLPAASLKATDVTGVALVAYLPPGQGTMTATNSAHQVTSKASYITRAGAVTTLLAPMNQ